MRVLHLSILYFIPLSCAFAQQAIHIKGAVLDKGTNQGISYAHVMLQDGADGTVANNDGEFQLAVTVNGGDPYVYFSSIGYSKDSVKLSAISQTTNFRFFLEGKVVMLDAVEIFSKKLVAHEIVTEAAKRVKDNYYQNEYNQEIFYRTQVRRNDSIFFNEEASVLLFDKSGYQPKAKAFASMYGQILQFRNTTNNPSKDPWVGTGSLWKVFTHDLILDKDNILNRTNAYNTTLTNIIEQDGETIFEISFFCKNPNAMNTGFGFPDPVGTEGKLYINESDFAVLKYEHCIKRGSYDYKKIDFRDENWAVILVQSYKQFQGKYFLHHSKQLHAKDVLNVKTGKRLRMVEVYDVLSSRIDTEAKQKPTTPLDKLTTGKPATVDLDFWKKHNMVIEDRNISLKCVN